MFLNMHCADKLASNTNGHHPTPPRTAVGIFCCSACDGKEHQKCRCWQEGVCCSNHEHSNLKAHTFLSNDFLSGRVDCKHRQWHSKADVEAFKGGHLIGKKKKEGHTTKLHTSRPKGHGTMLWSNWEAWRDEGPSLAFFSLLVISTQKNQFY